MRDHDIVDTKLRHPQPHTQGRNRGAERYSVLAAWLRGGGCYSQKAAGGAGDYS
jgi:hypothetical protein